MHKSISKRIRITKNGKIVRRAMGVNHFRSKKSSRTKQNLKKSRGLNTPVFH